MLCPMHLALSKSIQRGQPSSQIVLDHKAQPSRKRRTKIRSKSAKSAPDGKHRIIFFPLLPTQRQKPEDHAYTADMCRVPCGLKCRANICPAECTKHVPGVWYL